MVSNTILIGDSEEHIDFVTLEKPVHKLLVRPWVDLQNEAERAGFELKIASGFRTFQHQLAIWNEKALGKRVVLDDAGVPIEVMDLSNTERVFAILRWSALPGTSRHHWGTDVDIYDAKNISINKLQLVPREYEGKDGPCAALYHWLKSNLPNGFYWPYLFDSGGLAPEPWHLSYRPLSEKFEQQLSVDFIAEIIRASDIELKPEILHNLDNIFEKYIKYVSHI